MRHKTPKFGFTWRSVTAVAMAVSLLLGIVVGESASAQTNDKQTSLPAATMLERYTRDITATAEQGKFDSFSDQQAEINRAIEILARGSQNNPVVLTESQAARNVIIAGVARQIVRGNVPESLLGRRVLKLDLDKLFKDTKNAEDLKNAIATILSEASNSDSKVILFVDPIQTLIGSTAAFDATVSEVLREALANGSVQCFGASTNDTFAQSIGNDERLAALFTKIELNEAGSANAEQAVTAEDENNSSNAEEFVGDKVSDELRELIQSGEAPERVKVILQVNDLKSSALRAQLAEFGVTVSDEIPRFGTLAIEVPTKAITKLASDNATNYLSLDRQVKGLGHVETTTGDEAMLAQPRNVGLEGNGVGVAVLDSGISSKPKGLAGRVVYSRDFTGEGTTEDFYGHGTFVASMIAAKRGSYGGIASGANLVNFRVLNSKGVGSMSAVLNALNAVMQYRTQYNIRIVNLSLGSVAVDSYKNDPLCRAVRRLVNAGIVVIAAAGNDGKDAKHAKLYGRIHAPGNEPSAITVGAANTFGTDKRSDDIVTTFSSRGPTRSFWKDAKGVKHYDNLMKPDLVAPGNKIIGAAGPDNKLESENPELCVAHCGKSANNGKGAMRLSGTSVSAPIVAGAVAVMLEANPNLTPNMIKMILMYSAQSLKGYNMLEQGAGELNIEGAVRLARSVRTDLSASTTLGAPLLTSTAPNATTTIAGETFRWSQGVILNHNWATGTDLITKYQAVYRQGVLLSDGVLISDGVLLADAAQLTKGVLLSDNIMVSNGITMADGTVLMSNGVLLSDGVLLTDGVAIADGLVLADKVGVVLSDGIVLADRAGVVMADRVGVVLADAYRAILGDKTSCMSAE